MIQTFLDEIFVVSRIRVQQHQRINEVVVQIVQYRHVRVPVPGGQHLEMLTVEQVNGPTVEQSLEGDNLESCKRENGPRRIGSGVLD